MRRALACSVFFVAACYSPSPKPAPAAPAAGASAAPGRIVALADLHGDSAQTLAALRLAGLVNDQGAWVGGTTTLIQLGDATDRGPDSRGVLALLRRLSTEAKAQGGEVVTLLGNHEVMNMQGDWRYVSPGDVATYGGQEARIQAFLPGGEEGTWLRTLPAVVQRGDTVFVHAGITPRWAALGLDELNRQVREAIERPGSPILGPDSPLWYRGFVEDETGATCADLRESLQKLGARRMIVGHTRTKDNRVQARCQGALLAADVSLSGVYQGGHLGALELLNGDARALYPNGPEDLPEPE